MSFSFSHILKQTPDFLLPPLCLACDNPVGTDHTLCPACWSRIHFITKPFCAQCGTPFDVPIGEGSLGGGCIAHPPLYHAARAVMLYDDASKGLVLASKYGDRTHEAQTLASWMMRAGEEFVPEADYIMPIPLHRWRLFKRRYNQAALLAKNLSHLTRKIYLPDVLIRKRATPPQGQMKRKERHENVKGAFNLKNIPRFPLLDKKILLIDDVLTTGATVNECSQLLLEAGVKTINVLTLARVRGYLQDLTLINYVLYQNSPL